MPLPPYERVIFQQNPLHAVTAELRYSPILRIQTETPAAFQESIRNSFPGYALVNPASGAFPAEIPMEVQTAMQAGFGFALDRFHRFISADGKTVVQLSQQTVSVTSNLYHHWQDFRSSFEPVVASFSNLYTPAVTQVGLRYQNLIERSKLNLSNVAWSELFQPFIAAEFGCPGIGEKDVLGDMHRFQIKVGQDRIVVQHGMATNQMTKEPVYFLDNSFVTTEKVGIPDVFSRLDSLNKHSGSLFRLCITERLYQSLGPGEA